MKKRKVPLRMCLGCGEMKPKKELIRIVKNEEGLIGVDGTGKKNGRGAYVCAEKSCVESISKYGKLNKTFKTGVSEDVFNELFRMLGEMNG